MIRVVRITGESFDIETGEQVSKALVLSNGTDEVHVPVREDIIKAVLHLYWHAPEMTKAPEEVYEPEVVTEAPPVEEVYEPEVVTEAPPVDDDRNSTYDDPRSGTASI